MGKITVKLLKKEEKEQGEAFLFYWNRELLWESGFVFLAYDDGTPCGALGALQTGDELCVVSLFVDPASRRRGAALALLKEAEELAVSMGVFSLTSSYVCGEFETAVHLAFLKRGFFPPRPGSKIYTAKLENLKDSYLASLPQAGTSKTDQTYLLGQLPKAVQNDYKSRLGKDIPGYMSMDRAVGDALPELCFASVRNGRLLAMVLTTEAEGTLHLAGAYLEDGRQGQILLALLQHLLKKVLKLSGRYEEISVTGATEKGRNLAERLLAGADYHIKQSFAIEKPLFSREMVYPPGYEGVRMRFDALARELAKRNVSSRQVMRGGMFPYMELEAEGTDTPAEFYYSVPDPDTYEEFVLEAVLPSEGQDAYSETLHEPQILDPERVIDGFILPFLKRAGKAGSL